MKIKEKLLTDEFEMKDLGLAKRIRSMDINRDRIKGIVTLS